MKITNKDFIRLVSKESGYTQKDIAGVLDSIRTVLIDAAKRQNTVKVFNGLTMEGKQIDARAGRNPQTGESITIPAHTRMTFKVTAGLKRDIEA